MFHIETYFFCRGKNVLNQKTELQRALQRQKENLAKKQLENHIAAQTPELEKVIADRAKRLQHPNEEKVSILKLNIVSELLFFFHKFLLLDFETFMFEIKGIKVLKKIVILFEQNPYERV